MPVPPELAPLLNHRLESGYTGVYPHRGKWRWCEPFTKKHHAGYSTPKDAARQLLAWWVFHFGDDWVSYFRARSAVPWIVSQDSSGCWSFLIYVKGSPVPLPPPKKPLPDRPSARRYVFDYCQRRYGAEAWRYVRRKSPVPTHERILP